MGVGRSGNGRRWERECRILSYRETKNSREFFFTRCAIPTHSISFWTIIELFFLSNFQNIVNGGVRIFICQRFMSSFLWNCFSIARLSSVCSYILLFCCECLGMG